MKTVHINWKIVAGLLLLATPSLLIAATIIWIYSQPWYYQATAIVEGGPYNPTTLAAARRKFLDNHPIEATTQITFRSLPPTKLLAVSVTHSDPMKGIELANELAEKLVRDVRLYASEVMIFEKAFLVCNPSKPNVSLCMITAGSVGVLLTGLGMLLTVSGVRKMIVYANQVAS